jgi:hypothetical protein
MHVSLVAALTIFCKRSGTAQNIGFFPVVRVIFRGGSLLPLRLEYLWTASLFKMSASKRYFALAAGAAAGVFMATHTYWP